MDQITNDAILEAAALQFATKGFDGARVDEIAAAAGVNKATLYYRVGDKAALYGAVLEKMLHSAADRIAAATAAVTDPEEQLAGYVRGMASSARHHTYFAPIMLREVAGGGAHMPDAALGQMGRILNTLEQSMRLGVERGLFRAVNPFVAHMLVVGSLMFFNAGAPIRARVAANQGLDLGPSPDISPDLMTEQLAELVLGALKNA